MTSHRERKSVIACCVKSGARVFSDVVLITPSVLTAKTGRSVSWANGGGVFAEVVRSALPSSPVSPLIGALMNAPERHRPTLPALLMLWLVKRQAVHRTTCGSGQRPCAALRCLPRRGRCERLWLAPHDRLRRSPGSRRRYRPPRARNPPRDSLAL